MILAIETSCDDTSLCLLKPSQEINKPHSIISHLTYSQKFLEKWGGVVPELSARSHAEKLPLLLEQLERESQISTKNDLDGIAVTTHPGLLGPLITGISLAKTIALISQKPIIPVNHLYAHLEAIYLTHTQKEIPYPYLGLLISGGHGIFFVVHSTTHFEIIGDTVDDAPGEAFDKGGRLMNLPYPAGKHIDDLAKKGNEKRFTFPIPMKSAPTPTFSFSGSKTALKYFLEDESKNHDFENQEGQDFFDLCASYQESIAETIFVQTKKALKIYREKFNLKQEKFPLVVGGGVAANSRVRTLLAKLPVNSFFVKNEFCTDNAAMIANYAARAFQQKVEFPDCLSLEASSRLKREGEVSS